MKTVILFLSFLSMNSSTHDVSRIDVESLLCLSKAVYHEARGEPAIGKAAVAHVVMNRVGHPWYRESICEVVYQGDGVHFTGIDKREDFSETSWNESVEVATLSYLGYIDDPTNGAIMYHNPYKVPEPRWDFTKLALVGKIHNHMFFKEKERGEV